MSSKRSALAGQISDFDIRLLRIYKTVVECGGFSAAEVELNISRPAISTAIADLEKRVGMRLCQRGRAGFSLTDEGQEVYEAVLQLLASLETFRTQVNAIHSQLKGELNIGIADNLVTMHHQMRVTHALAKLKQLGPEVRINIRMIPPNEVEMNVLDGRLHIGVIPEHHILSGLEYYPLYDEESRLYCGFSHPLFEVDDQTLTADDLTQLDAVIPAYAQTPQIKTLHHNMKATATASDREGVAFLILTGEFIGYLPTHMAERWVSENRMRALLPEQMYYATAYAAITRKGARPNLILETYMEALGVA